MSLLQKLCIDGTCMNIHGTTHQYISDSQLRNGWVAPQSGIVNIVVAWNNTTSTDGGYCYINDITDNIFGVLLSTAILRGAWVTGMMPVIKDHKYKVDIENEVRTLYGLLFLIEGGGNM